MKVYCHTTFRIHNLGTYFIIMLITLSSAQAWACTREDIDYYLNNGFNPNQVTVLCSSQKNSVAREIKDKTNNPSHLVTPSPLVLLSTGIKASNIYVTDTDLHYTHKECIEYGPANQYKNKKTICPIIDFKIAKQNVKIGKLKRISPFFGDQVIIVNGNTHRNVQNFDQYNTKQQNILKYHLSKKTNEVRIPLRRDAQAETTQAALAELMYN